MFFLRIFVTTLFLTGLFLAVQPAEATKPMAPLEMSLELGGTPQVGGEVPVVLKIRSFIEVPLVKIQLTLPNGIEMVSGQDTWEGELTAGSLKELTFVLKIKESGRHVVRAMVIVEYPSGSTVGKGAALLIDLETPSTLGVESNQQGKPKKRVPVIRKGEDGQDDAEFTLE